MNENARKTPSATKQVKRSLKHYVAVILFGAIIVVFGLWGVNPARMGGSDAIGGVAATVNDASISLSAYRNRVESIEQNAKMRFDQFPEAQRRMLTQELRRRALEELINHEMAYQAAERQGIVASDAEVRDTILQIPVFSENGRFRKERYRAFLENMNLSTDDFEHEMREEVVGQKLQELFVGSAAPSDAEIKMNRQLTQEKLSLRFVEFRKEDMLKPGFLKPGDVENFEKTHQADIEKYYKDNAVEFTSEEKIKARHILIRVDEKRNEAEALKIAKELKGQATPANFAKLAAKSSDDPGSKDKGGELGEFGRKRMVPEFEKAAFDLKEGQISEPVKTSYGYHLIYVEKKSPAGVTPLAQASAEIARKLLLRGKESEVVASVNELLAKGKKADVDQFLKKAQLTWVTSGEFDLASPVIPKLGDSQEILQAVVKHGPTPGLIPNVIKSQDNYVIVDVLSWKTEPDKGGDLEGVERMLANRNANDLIEAWSKQEEAKAAIQRNARILQQ